MSAAMARQAVAMLLATEGVALGDLVVQVAVVAGVDCGAYIIPSCLRWGHS